MKSYDRFMEKLHKELQAQLCAPKKDFRYYTDGHDTWFMIDNARIFRIPDNTIYTAKPGQHDEHWMPILKTKWNEMMQVYDGFDVKRVDMIPTDAKSKWTLCAGELIPNIQHVYVRKSFVDYMPKDARWYAYHHYKPVLVMLENGQLDPVALICPVMVNEARKYYSEDVK